MMSHHSIPSLFNARGKGFKTLRLRWIPIGLVFLFALAYCSPVWAVIVLDQESDASDGTFHDAQISNSDLINISQLTLSGVPTTNYAPFTGYSVTGLHDASAANTVNRGFWIDGNPVPITGPVTVTFALNTVLNPLGYDITSIRSINGHSGSPQNYANQSHSIYYRLVGDPVATYTLLQTLNYAPFSSNTGAGSTMVTVSDDTGLLLSGVAELQFRIPIVAASGQSGVYREFDVFGMASPTPPPVPEPSTFMLLGVGVGLTVSARRRSKRRLAVAA